MMQRQGSKISLIILVAVWLGLALWAWLKPTAEISATERRELKQFPQVTVESLIEGKFAAEFDGYALDQFPLRDGFRTLKAAFHYGVLRQKDNNGIYLFKGQAAKLEYPLKEASIQHAVKVFGSIYEKYLQDSQVYAAMIPDKGYYLAEQGGYLALDYDNMENLLQQGMPFASYVNLKDLLTAEDYYRTDTHWRQERLLPVAQRLCQTMGTTAPQAEDFTAVTAQRPFYGVYYGQAALPMTADALVMMESDLLNGCQVYNYETNQLGQVYEKSKLEGDDLYEVFLSGPVSLLTMENPHGDTDRELIIFRDSFGSALAPLLMSGYQKITLVDVRYLSSAMLERFLDFHGQDVLFLYSSLVLNNSGQLK